MAEMGDKKERVTIIVPTLDSAAFEIHRQNMWEKGYRLEHPIVEQSFFQSNEGKEPIALFEGKPMYALSFIKG